MIDTSTCRRLQGKTAFESILATAPDREKFMAEVGNYFEGGVVVNTPRVFIMAKPVDSSLEPSGQWWVEKPDAWYVRWAAGEGSMKLMMQMGTPLPFIVFRRIKEGATGKWKRYEWKKLFRRVAGH